MRKFVATVKREMRRQKIMYTQLARDVGVGSQYLYRVLAGEQVPSVAWAEKVAKWLRIEIHFRVPRTEMIK